MKEIDELASELRQAFYNDEMGWEYLAERSKEQWRRVALRALEFLDLE